MEQSIYMKYRRAIALSIALGCISITLVCTNLYTQTLLQEVINEKATVTKEKNRIELLLESMKDEYNDLLESMR